MGDPIDNSHIRAQLGSNDSIEPNGPNQHPRNSIGPKGPKKCLLGPTQGLYVY